MNADQRHEDEEIEEYEDEGEQHDSEAEIDDSPITKLEASASEVWKYFTKDSNFKQNKKAKCDVCGVTYTCSGGSTSNLLKHINKKHFAKQKQELKITDVFNISAKVNILNFFFCFLFMKFLIKQICIISGNMTIMKCKINLLNG